MIDVIAIFPTQVIESWINGSNIAAVKASKNQTRLVRLSKLPRLYRLIRLLRMLKMLRLVKRADSVKNLVSNFIITAGMIRLGNMLILQLIMVHLMACFWYMAATFEDNIWDTWVGSRGIAESSLSYQYYTSFYWAFQVVTTVGYGDFAIGTQTEYIFCIFWMFAGCSFYSFTISTITGIICDIDFKNAALNQKLVTVAEYSKKFTLPLDTQ